MSINCGHDGGRYDHESGLIQLALLEIREIEAAVANNWSAEAYAILRLSHGKGSLRQSVRRIESAVSNITVEITVKRVAAAAGDDIDVPSERAAEFSLSAGCDHLHFFDNIQTVECAGQS